MYTTNMIITEGTLTEYHYCNYPTEESERKALLRRPSNDIVKGVCCISDFDMSYHEYGLLSIHRHVHGHCQRIKIDQADFLSFMVLYRYVYIPHVPCIVPHLPPGPSYSFGQHYIVSPFLYPVGYLVICTYHLTSSCLVSSRSI